MGQKSRQCRFCTGCPAEEEGGCYNPSHAELSKLCPLARSYVPPPPPEGRGDFISGCKGAVTYRLVKRGLHPLFDTLGKSLHLLESWASSSCFEVMQFTGEIGAQKLSTRGSSISLFFFFLILIYLFLFIFGCVGSSFLCEGFL